MAMLIRPTPNPFLFGRELRAERKRGIEHLFMRKIRIWAHWHLLHVVGVLWLGIGIAICS